MIRRVPSRQRNARVARESDRDAFFRLGLLLFCGLGLASGFVYAGRQHFVALKYGYETEKLRAERDQLAEQQRRLVLQREAAASPIRLEKAAKQLGMQPLQPAQIDPIRQAVVAKADVNPAASLARETTAKPDVAVKAKPTTKPQNRAPNKPI